MIVSNEIKRVLKLVFGDCIVYDRSKDDFKTGAGNVYFRINSYSTFTEMIMVNGTIFSELVSSQLEPKLVKQFSMVKHNFQLSNFNIDSVNCVELVDFHYFIDTTKVDTTEYGEINHIILEINEKDTLEVSDDESNNKA